MSTPDTFDALRSANPRLRPGFASSVEAVAARIVTAEVAPAAVRRRRPRFVRLAAVAAVVGVAAGVAALTVGPRGGTPGVEDATAAVRKAATATAAAADRSGTAVVRISHDGELWAGSTIRWNGDDISVRNDSPDRAGKVGGLTLVVGGTLYARDPRTGEWLDQGSPANIDPDSGTTPTETLAAVREDVGGVTLRRLARGVTGFSTSRVGGSTVYRGKVAAGLVARETGFKDGQELRVFPFGYVAHDEAADPAALLDAALTVGADGVVRQIALSWGTWRYTVTYSGLGTTPALVAPRNARSLLKERLRAVSGG
jgi:hypothetical protein